MDLDDAQYDAVQLAGAVKGRMVGFASSTPFRRHLDRLLREATQISSTVADPTIAAVERLLFEFRYDNGTTVVDRFLQLPDLTEAERDMARGFTQGVEGIFEVVAETPAGASAFTVRCCLSDLEHVVAPTEPAGVPALELGTFLAGRLNPIAGTDLWTTSGALEHLPPSQREAIAGAVMELALRAPWLTHRNPEKARMAAEQVAIMHERFVERHGHDLVMVEGEDLAAAYADVVAPTEDRDPDDVARAQALARQTIEDSELVHARQVAMVSHPVAGIGFYQDFDCATRALDKGAAAAPDDLDVLRGYLDDEAVPSWLLRRLIEERLPTSSEALAKALNRPGFDWKRDGDQLLASAPGDHEPTVTLAIVPSLCSEGAR